MTSQTADKGRLKALSNADKQPGDEKPAFHGTLTMPDGSERELTLWAHRTKQGQTLLSGHATESAARLVDALAGASPAPSVNDPQPVPPGDLKPYGVVLYTNTEPGPEKKPQYWGYYHPGQGQFMHLSVWAENASSRQVKLSGQVRPWTPKQVQAEPAPEPKPAPKSRKRQAM